MRLGSPSSFSKIFYLPVFVALDAIMCQQLPLDILTTWEPNRQTAVRIDQSMPRQLGRTSVCNPAHYSRRPWTPCHCSQVTIRRYLVGRQLSHQHIDLLAQLARLAVVFVHH